MAVGEEKIALSRGEGWLITVVGAFGIDRGRAPRVGGITPYLKVAAMAEQAGQTVDGSRS
jgi:hypothetical protein